MLKRITTVLASALLMTAVAFAGGDKKKSQPVDDPTGASTVGSARGGNVNTPLGQTAITTMPNALGTGTVNIYPLTYDPFSDAYAFIHRGSTTAGSGTISYNWSTDGGTTWSADAAPFNGGTVGTGPGRYPSGAVSNKNGVNDPSQLKIGAAYPCLNPSAFGWLGYGSETAFGTYTFATSKIDSSQGSTGWDFPYEMTTNITASGRGNIHFLAQALSGTTAPTPQLYLFTSTDGGATYAKTTAFTPGTGAGNYNTIYNVVGLDVNAGKVHAGLYGLFPSDTNNLQVGYAFSTNGGTSFSSFSTVKPYTLAGLAGNVHTFGTEAAADGTNIGNTQMSMVADNLGNPHFLMVLVDTVRKLPAANSNTGVYEITYNGSAWSGKLVAKLKKFGFNGANVNLGGYSLNEPEMGRDSSGKVLVAKWLDSPAGDTIPDIYVSGRVAALNSWNPATNITSTPAVREKQTHLAKYVKVTGTGTSTKIYPVVTWTKFGTDDLSSSAASVTYAVNTTSGVTLAAPSDGVYSVPSKYKLEQNYPNPFNPSTSINYSLAQASKVTLKVYDLLGREVATLVNETKPAGDYSVRFNASNLASGVYLYKVQAGTFSETRKMILVK